MKLIHVIGTTPRFLDGTMKLQTTFNNTYIDKPDKNLLLRWIYGYFDRMHEFRKLNIDVTINDNKTLTVSVDMEWNVNDDSTAKQVNT